MRSASNEISGSGTTHWFATVLMWLASLFSVFGLIITTIEVDGDSILLFSAGLLLTTPLLNGVYSKIKHGRYPQRLVLALVCYAVLFLPALNGASARTSTPVNTVTENPHPVFSGYYNSPWSGEDGGPSRQQSVKTLPGLDLHKGQKARATIRTVRHANMVLLRDPGEVYLMQTSILRSKALGLPATCRVEKIDPLTLQTVKRSPVLRGGPMWPGGFAIHRNGDLYVTFGRWCHRLNKDCHLLASYKLPHNAPYNSLVILDNGYLAMKNFSTKASYLTILDPTTMQPVCAEIPLHEPSIARLGAVGNTLYIVGTKSVFRYAWDSQNAQPVLDRAWIHRYIRNPRQTFGWDPVIGDGNVWFLDNGQHGYLWMMRKAGISPTANNYIGVPLKDTRDIVIAPVSGMPQGTVTNPPFYSVEKRVLVVYDSGNAVIRAFRHNPVNNQLAPLWEKHDFGQSSHMLYFLSTNELCVNDYTLGTGDDSVVLDLESGQEKGRAAMHNMFQGVIFPCPGWNRDYYYVTFDRIARVFAQ